MPIGVRAEGERFRFMPNQYRLHDRTACLAEFPVAGCRDAEIARVDRATHNPATMRTFDITLDGKAIVFDRMKTNSDIVLIDLPPRQ